LLFEFMVQLQQRCLIRADWNAFVGLGMVENSSYEPAYFSSDHHLILGGLVVRKIARVSWRPLSYQAKPATSPIGTLRHAEGL
jgi:hypothetical protein